MDRKIRYILLGAVSALVLLLLMGVPTALVPTSLFTRMIPATSLDYTFLAATSGLAGAYISLSVYRRRDSNKATGSAFAGAVGGIFAFGCPLCNAVIMSLIGTSTILAYYVPFTPFIGLASVGLLATAVYLKARDRGCDTCEQPGPGREDLAGKVPRTDISAG
ncbi:MAG: hypothetical protein V3U31_02090 [Dehalococcoidia bacterium]